MKRSKDNQNFRNLVLQKETRLVPADDSSRKRKKHAKSNVLVPLDEENRKESIHALIREADRAEHQRKKRAIRNESRRSEAGQKEGAVDDGEGELELIWRKGKKIKVKKKQEGLMRIPRVEGGDESEYIDRAALRRKDGGVAADEFEKARAFDANESKYMGGDLEHTHYVKGLDYMLLKKIRTEHESNKDEIPTTQLETLVQRALESKSRYSSAYEYLNLFHATMGHSNRIVQKHKNRKITYRVDVSERGNLLTDIPEQYIASRTADANGVLVDINTIQNTDPRLLNIAKESFDWIRTNLSKPEEEREIYRTDDFRPHKDVAVAPEDDFDMFT